MATVSEQLRLGREQQQLDVYQVAEITKMKTDHIRALESGVFDIFPAPVYIRGFVRTYATMLKLNVPQVLADLDGELGQSEKFREPPPLTNSPRSPLDFVMLQLTRLNWRIAFGVGAIVIFLILAVAVIRSRSGRPADPLKNLGPGVYHPRTNKPGDTLPLPVPTQKR
jgi:cytoskeletal protein RodZ